MSAKRSRIILKARIIQAIRAFFTNKGFVEVFTPFLTRAPAPEPYIEAMGVEDGFYLIPSPELNIKRLMAETGLEKVFQLGPVFRKEEKGRFHNPEFIMLEWYSVGNNYFDLMDECEELIGFVLESLGMNRAIEYRGKQVDFTPPFKRLTVKEAFSRFAGWTPSSPLDEEKFDLDFVEKVEVGLASMGPAFVYDWPRERASLSRLKEDDPTVAERVELYAGGLELGNGFSELTDPGLQAERFKVMIEERQKMGKRVYPWPKDFLESLSKLQPCAGMAFGVDRFTMLIANAETIDEVLPFSIDNA
ncbi:Translation elongation factor P Lys34:lysine transferase [Dissulfuribacter thermophilus]|uniref:Translation elongation factor P Lys34:lysine transferase n=1 Tax=Dissulfuribacter thermophilus TaxID=1156395 RepID=A0A1B9F4M6_9BACT|nr:amino acid--tRNA ligase-related protein [Dissulfuribacter thermophilus]OCC14813.1 Translation elongation factor P Lys34:lysine transferase [Dissulfuribacter thermophilus]